MSHFTAEELDKYDVEELRKILKNIYDRILATKKTDRKDIEKSISGAIKNRSVSYKLMGSSTLRNFIKNPTYKPNRASEKIIGFIRFLSETYNIQMQIDEVVDYYDIFYWRTDGSGGNGKAGKETIGVARLKITNWKDAELKYFYHSQKAPYAYLTGKVEMYNNGIHLYLEDGTGTERDPIKNKRKDLNYGNNAELSTKAHSYLVLYNADRNKNEVMTGCLSSKNRLQNWVMSSITVCQKSQNVNLEKSSFISDFENGKRRVQHIDPKIQYYLSGRQIRTEHESNILDDIDSLPTSEYARLLQGFKGTFQNIHFSTNSKKEELKSYVVLVEDNGLASVIKGSEEKSQSIDRGRARIVTENRILLQFNYDAITRAFQYSLLLTKSDTNYFEGIYFGLINNELASGRVLLKKMTDKILDIDDTSISKVLKRIEIGESTKTNPLQKLTEIVGNDQKVIDFFTDNRFDSFTDAVLKRIFQSDTHKSKETDKKFQNKLPIDVLGRYICYFNVKNVREEGPKHDSSSYGQVLNIVPLEIFEDKVVIKYQSVEIEGTYSYVQGKDKVMLIFLHDTYYINIFFRATKNPQFIYGMFNIINDKNKLTEEQDSIQSSYLMMKKTPTEFKELRFQQISEQNDLIKIEKELEIGVITMVFGHYQRTVLTRENNIKNDLSKIVKLYPRQQSYRRTFWNSACLNSMQYNECEEEIAQISSNQDDNAVERSGKIAALEEKKKYFLQAAQNDLKRAYHHGFGSKYHGNSEFGDSDFPVDLKEEYEMLKNEYEKKRFFKNEDLRRFLAKSIDFEYKSNSKIDG